MAAVNKVQECPDFDLGALLDAGDSAVVTLVTGDTQLAAHRAVLVARSPVFAAMFGHNMLEASSGRVEVPDVEGAVLRQLLSYCYTLRDPQLPAMAPQLLAAADKYGVSSLKARCEQQLGAQLAVENAAATAVLAVQHSCPGLKQAAIAYIKDHTHQVMATQGWTDAVLSQPRNVAEVSRLLSQPPAESSSPATMDSGPRPRNKHAGPRVVAAPPATSRNAPPPEEAVFQMRSLSGDEKGRKLRKAAKIGAVPELQTLLAAGADVGASDGGGWTALHWAANTGNLEAVRCLIQAGAEVDARNSAQNTPLHTAAMNGHNAVVEALVQSSADPNARNSAQNTPLHTAAMNGHTAVVEALVQSSADPNAKGELGMTPLHWGALLHSGGRGVVSVLLRVGANRYACDSSNRSPFKIESTHH